MDLIRLNIVDHAGTISVVAPCHAIKVAAAACARNPQSLGELLDLTERYDPQFKPHVLDALAVFDEHNTPQNPSVIHESLQLQGGDKWCTFRVLDEITREASLEPVKAGLVIFNLPAKRIIQVHNAYANLERRDRGRVRDGEGQPTGKLYHYKLPEEWLLLP